MKSIAMVIFTVAAALPAGSDPAGFDMWKSAQLKGFEKKLAPKINAQKVATQPLAKYSNGVFMVAHREGNGEAELHESQDDLMIMQSGEASLIVGGTMVDAKTTAPHEMRGPSISGGEKKKLGPGDVVHIPAKTPHQMMVDDGKQVTYAIMKIDQK